jgi:hypothetical protein
MKTRIFESFTVAVAALTAGAALAGCDGGSEGDRCNPDLSHDECSSGLVCSQPDFCPENYCCPTKGPFSSPYCEPGCSGGAQSICNADPSNADACAYARPVIEAGEDGGSSPVDAGGGKG